MGLLFCSFALWFVPHRYHHHEELHQNGGQMLLSGIYPIAGLVFLALTAVLVRRDGAAAPDAGPGAVAPGR